jgi:hypothetical protein
MKFYKEQHQHYCGIDLHAKKIYVCIANHLRDVILHKNIDTDRETFLRLIAEYRKDLVVGVECMFCWYWVADL